LLQSFYHKAHRVSLETGTQATDPQHPHALELPFDADKLDEIFEKSRHLLSEDLIAKYLEYVKQDTACSIYQSRKVVGPNVTLVNLKDMQSAAEKEFDLLNKKYKELVA
jgi:hypothetical protein